jgi:hypothetical protein
MTIAHIIGGSFLFLIFSLCLLKLKNATVNFATDIIWLHDAVRCQLIYCVPENEIDGCTLVKLTETMVAKLIPKMRQQVQFLQLQASLIEGLQSQSAAVPGASAASSVEGSDSEDEGHANQVPCTVASAKDGLMLQTVYTIAIIWVLSCLSRCCKIHVLVIIDVK